MRYALLALSAILLSGCATTKLVPQAYMPKPPSILMREPVELNTIKQVDTQEEEPDETL